MSEAQPIPRNILDRAARRFCRHTAATLVSAMGETDTDFATIDARLGQKPGWTKRRLEWLIAGTSVTLDVVSDIAFAMGCRVNFTLHRLAPEDVAPQEGAAASSEMEAVA